VRRHEPTIVFGGVDTGVANSKRTDGLTFLDDVWAHAPFATQQRLAAQVDRTAADWHLSPAETSSIRKAVASAARALG
jgi:hypothetical protein